MTEPELKHSHSDSRDLAFVHYPKALSEAQFHPRMLQTLFKGAMVLISEAHIGPGPHPSMVQHTGTEIWLRKASHTR